MYISDCMRTQVFTVAPEACLTDAMQLMGHHMVGSIPVVGEDKHIAGVIVLDDLLTEFMPKFVHMLRVTDFIHHYGSLEFGPGAEQLKEKLVTEIMRPPYFLKQDCGLMEAMVFMHNHDIVDVPVVDEEERLVGLVSQVRVGSLFLIDWLGKNPEKDE